MKPKNVQVYYLFRCDDPKRPSHLKTDEVFELEDFDKVRQLKLELDDLRINYDLLIERFDSRTDCVLSNDYIVEYNHFNG